METMLIPTCEFALTLCRQLRIPRTRLAPVIYYGPDETNFDPQRIEAANLRQEFGWPEDTPVITNVAYFYHRMPISGWMPSEVHGRGHKGHEDLVRAAPRVLQEFPNAKFLLVGSGWEPKGEAYLDEIRAMVRDLELQDSVIFTGYRADANRILRESNVAVQAALNENLGGTIEALLMECPTVATRVGGMIDAVRDGETGVLVNPSNSHDLARGIITLLRDEESAKALGRAGRRWMLSRFTLKRTVEELDSLYERLIAQEAGARYRILTSIGRAFVGVPIFLFVVIKTFLLKLELPSLLRRRRSKPRTFTEVHESISN
jgi:glycosyltransferase involved in cell wall biosynthesis